MQINQAAMRRLRSAQLRAEAIATIFEVMIKAIEAGSSQTEFMLGYQSPEDTVADGDLVPVIVLALRPATKPVKPAEGQ